jgi:hypothetical protein
MAQEDLPAAAGADALTEALRAHRVLPDGRVAEVSLLSDHKALVSRVLRLRLVYDRPCKGAPDTIILKTGFGQTISPEWLGGRQEIAFYTEIAPALPDRLAPGCFGSRHDAETGAWHLLLEDLTDSHAVASRWPLPPKQAQCERIVTAHARLHAACWDDPRLGVSIGTWLDAETGRENRLLRLQRTYEAFADQVGDALLPAHRALYEQFIDALPRLWARYRTHRNMTITQGDSHVWNCFLPRDGGDDVRLFDWDSWKPHVAALDLAYMMALHWFPDRRQMMESSLLDHYHRVLVARGVSGYDRQMLTDDYRWGALMMLVVPPVQAAIKLPAGLWWNHLARIMMAIEDLGCRELLS